MISTEAKVGAMTLAALTLLAGMIISLSHFSFGEKGYPVSVLFRDVAGLVPGNIVRYAGVQVGRVETVSIEPGAIRVVMQIKKDTAIPAQSHFTIGSDGLLGEKFISIVPPAAADSSMLEPGAIVQGDEPQGLATLIASAEKVLGDVHALVQSLNDILGDEKVKTALKDSALNAKVITDNLNALSASLARMAVNNEQDVNAMVQNMRAMSESLRLVADRVDSMLSRVDNNGQTASDLAAAVHNIKLTSDRIEAMAKSLEGVVTDPKTAANLKETLQNVHDASEKANKLLSKVSNISASGSVDAFYNPKRGKYRTDADLRVQFTPQNYALMGVDSIGDGSRLNFQVGSETNGFGKRMGVISGKAGVGLDAQVGEQMRFSVDVYDPNAVKVRLRSEYKLSDSISLIGQTDSINREASQNTYFGLRHAF
ncbi:MAG: MlaD family protein [Sporomusaceae bacterium]|nr:MlaD family protein [Sporomusaceae bacterium]